jgi:ribosome-binding factor A
MSVRLERLREIIRERAADFILFRLNDPRIGFCTVTRVDLAGDLSEAVIHVSVLGDETKKRTTMRGLNDARGLLQSHIAGVLRTRTTPHLRVELDETIEETFRILDKIREARAGDPDGGKLAEADAADVDAKSDADDLRQEAAEDE